MIFTMIKKELNAAALSLRFLLVFFIFCVLVPVSAWVLSSDYIREYEDYKSRVAMEERRDASIAFSNKVNRPVPQLAAFYRGVSLESINTIDLKIFVGWNRPATAVTQSVSHSLFPSVDLMFILSSVASLLALLLSFDAVSGEKSEATLRLIASNPVSRSGIIIGKWLGLCLTLLIPYLFGVLLCLVVFVGVTGLGFTPENWVAFGLSVAATVVYLSALVLIGLTISAFTPRPAISAFAALLVWGFLILLLPQAANVAADWIKPVESSQFVEKEKRALYNNFAYALRDRNMALSERALREGWEDGRVNQEWYAGEMEMGLQGYFVINSHEREYWNEVAAQEGVGRVLTMLSPAGALDLILIALADTGPESQRAFLRAAYDYGEMFYDELWKGRQGRPDAEAAAGIPKFRYEESDLGARISMALWPFFALVIMNALLIAVAVFGFNRYDVR